MAPISFPPWMPTVPLRLGRDNEVAPVARRAAAVCDVSPGEQLSGPRAQAAAGRAVQRPHRHGGRCQGRISGMVIEGSGVIHLVCWVCEGLGYSFYGSANVSAVTLEN